MQSEGEHPRPLKWEDDVEKLARELFGDTLIVSAKRLKIARTVQAMILRARIEENDFYSIFNHMQQVKAIGEKADKRIADLTKQITALEQND